MHIEDGRHKNGPAGVNVNQQLETMAVTVPEGFFVNHLGDAYNLNTDLITLTDDNEVPIFYAKNRHDEDLIISAIAFHAAESTGGSGNGYLRVYDAPTGGTIITDAAAIPIKANRRFSDPGTLDKLDAYLGSASRTFSGGEKAFVFGHGTGRMFASIDIVLPQGAEVLYTWEAPTGNTSQVIYLANIVYLRREGAIAR